MFHVSSFEKNNNINYFDISVVIIPLARQDFKPHAIA